MRCNLIRTLALATLISFGCHSMVRSQSINDSFFSQETSCDFNLPTIGLSLTLVPNMGFKVPAMEEYEAFISLDEGQASYFFNSDLISNDEAKFYFSKPGTDEAIMGFYLPVKQEDMDKMINKIKHAPYFKKMLSPIKTKLGEMDRYLLKLKDFKSIVYFGKDDDNMGISFSVLANHSKEVAQCEEVIKSLRKKEMPQELEEYKSKVDEGYFKYQESESEGISSEGEESERISSEDGDNAESAPLKEFDGKLEQPTTFNLPSLGMQLSIPANFNYKFRAHEMLTIPGDNLKQEIQLDENDLNNNSILFISFNADKLYFMNRIWKDMPDPKEQVDPANANQTVIKQFQLLVDGVVFEAIAVGSEEFPTIEAYAQLNGYGVNLSFMNVEKGSLETVEQILNGITFSDEQKEGLAQADTNIDPITKQLTIKERKIDPLQKITFAKAKDTNSKLVTYTFVDEGISCKLPLGVYETTWPEDGLITISPLEKQIKGTVANRLGVSSSLENLDEQFSVTIDTLKGTFADLSDMMVKNWSTYFTIDMIRTGIGTVNGKDWTLMEYKQASTLNACIFMTEYKGKFIMVSCSKNKNDNKKFDIGKYEGLLYYFTFD